MDTLWRIELPGNLRAVHMGRVVARFQTRQTDSLLVYLAFYQHRSYCRDGLVELPWPGCDLDDGRHRLRQALSSTPPSRNHSSPARIVNSPVDGS